MLRGRRPLQQVACSGEGDPAPHLDRDGGATPWRGVDQQRTAYHLDALAHVGEAEVPLRLQGRGLEGVEADAVVADQQAYVPVDGRQRDVDLGGVGVLAHVGEGFLRDPVQDRLQLGRQAQLRLGVDGAAHAAGRLEGPALVPQSSAVSCWTGPSCSSAASRERSASVTRSTDCMARLRSCWSATSPASPLMRASASRNSTADPRAITGTSSRSPRADWMTSTAGAISVAQVITTSLLRGRRALAGAGCEREVMDGWSAAAP